MAVMDQRFLKPILADCSILSIGLSTWVRGADFKPLQPQMDRPIDQDAFFTVIIVEGNLCCAAPALQAVIYA
jgi:hypothetical protein